MMANYFSLLLFIFFSLSGNAQERDYVSYHQNINKAEHVIFVDNKPVEGLHLFKSTLTRYDFVFVDDCIEAFQIALFYKKDDDALFFIKKALANGFELRLLDKLSMGCPCNYYKDDKVRVTIYEPFVAKYRQELEKYADACYPAYLKRINKEVLTNLMKRHVREQLFKDYRKGLSNSIETQSKEYYNVCDDNLRYMDSLAQRKIFIGEQNVGIYTDKLAKSINLPEGSIEQYLKRVLKFYGLPTDTYVPIQTEDSYFEIGFVYNMLFHNIKSYTVLSPYKNEAIKKGYLHPREYACLQLNNAKAKNTASIQLYLKPTTQMISDLARVDSMRQAQLLPDFETDFAKHQFAHAHNLQLSFGQFNDSR